MLPILYHAHHHDYKEDIPFWIELAARQGSPILEMGCGTGRVLVQLAQAGYEMFGLDKDPGMLAVLQENLAPGLREHTLIFSGDFTSFHLDLNFPLIIMPCNTYSTLSTMERQETLESARLHLCPGGVFAASLPNPDLLNELPSRSDPEIEDTFPHHLDGEPVQVSSAWERTSGGFTVHWHYDHLSPDGGVERFSTKVHHNLDSLQTYKAEIRGAGLQVVDIFGDFKKNPYTSDSPFLILVIGRQGR
jgi:SAM-dependent methyltransferase